MRGNANPIVAVVYLTLGFAVLALSVHLEREVRRLQRNFPGFQDRWKWQRRATMAAVIVSLLLILWRWL